MYWLIGMALVLGVMVLVHEWGHFVVARLFGVRVDVFSIGFGPRLFGWRWGQTDWRLSALPLGGYVRMAGQDLSEVDSSSVAPTGASDEVMSKPRWQRALISLAGPAVNLVMPIILLGGFYIIKGDPYPTYYDSAPVIASMSVKDPLAKLDVAKGDKLVEVNGVPTATWERVAKEINKVRAEDTVRLTVERQGLTHTVQVTGKQLAEADAPGRYVPIEPVIGQMSPGLGAMRAGMKLHDRIISVNGKEITTFPDFREFILNSDGTPLTTVVQRNGQLITLKLSPESLADEDGKVAFRLGVAPEDQFSYKKMGVGESLKNATLGTAYGMTKLLGVVGKLFSGQQSVKQLLGPVGIANMSGQAVQAGAFAVINLMAIISLNLGILNLLPIPILDGGHILLLAIEGILRRDLSLAFKERFVQVGLVFLFVLFSVVMYYDVARLLPTRG